MIRRCSKVGRKGQRTFTAQLQSAHTALKRFDLLDSFYSAELCCCFLTLVNHVQLQNLVTVTFGFFGFSFSRFHFGSNFGSNPTDMPSWLLGPSGRRCRRVGCLPSFCYSRLSSRAGALISWDLRCPSCLVLAVPVRCSFCTLAWTTSRRCCCCLARSLLFFGKFLITFVASSVFYSAPTTPDGF